MSFCYSTFVFSFLISFDCCFEIIGFAGFVGDHVGERERVAERLEQEAVENPVNRSQHFWQGEYNA